MLQLFLLFMSFSLAVEALHAFVQDESEHKDCKIDDEIQDVDLNSVALGIATSNTELSKDYKAKIKAEEDLRHKLITLQVLDESIDLITQLIKDISLQEKYQEATEISHVSREQPLIFFDEQIDEICNGCAKGISAPFYGCAQSKFTLHQWCAELPNELQHPFHPEHSFLLMTQQSMGNYTHVKDANYIVMRLFWLFCLQILHR